MRNRRYDNITPTGLPYHREPSIVLMSMPLMYCMGHRKVVQFAGFAPIENLDPGKRVSREQVKGRSGNCAGVDSRN